MAKSKIALFDYNDNEIVYLIQSDRYYKIGRTGNLNARLRSLQTANPTDLVVVDYFISQNSSIDEKNIHSYLQQYRQRGEWFEIPASVINSRDEWFYPVVLGPVAPITEPTEINEEAQLPRLCILFPGLLQRLGQLNDYDFTSVLQASHEILRDADPFLDVAVKFAEELAVEIINSQNLTGSDECLIACRIAGETTAKMIKTGQLKLSQLL